MCDEVEDLCCPEMYNIAIWFQCFICFLVFGKNSFESFNKQLAWNANYGKHDEHMNKKIDGDFVFPTSNQLVFPNSKEDNNDVKSSFGYHRAQNSRVLTTNLRKSDKSKYDVNIKTYLSISKYFLCFFRK